MSANREEHSSDWDSIWAVLVVPVALAAPLVELAALLVALTADPSMDSMPHLLKRSLRDSVSLAAADSHSIE